MRECYGLVPNSANVVQINVDKERKKISLGRIKKTSEEQNFFL